MHQTGHLFRVKQGYTWPYCFSDQAGHTFQLLMVVGNWQPFVIVCLIEKMCRKHLISSFVTFFQEVPSEQQFNIACLEPFRDFAGMAE